MDVLALIPARSGSKRVADKNIKELAGRPLMTYTIDVAINSGCFQNIVVCTDSEKYASIAQIAGAEVPYLRSPENAGDRCPDILWVNEAVEQLSKLNLKFDAICILRPTSPFRTTSMLKRALRRFRALKHIDSLRAVQECTEHPAKMWRASNDIMYPLLPYDVNGVPWHSNQKTQLPKIYVQNASLEIVHKRVILNKSSISGDVIAPFFTDGYEGYDINSMNDWLLAETLLAKKTVIIQ